MLDNKYKTTMPSIWICLLYTESASLTACKLPEFRVFSGPHFTVLSPNTSKHGAVKTPNLIRND